MTIEVNCNGKETEFSTIEAAIEFCEQQMENGNGSDVWVNEELHRTYMYNPFTGNFEIS